MSLMQTVSILSLSDFFFKDIVQKPSNVLSFIIMLKVLYIKYATRLYAKVVDKNLTFVYVRSLKKHTLADKTPKNPQTPHVGFCLNAHRLSKLKFIFVYIINIYIYTNCPKGIKVIFQWNSQNLPLLLCPLHYALIEDNLNTLVLPAEETYYSTHPLNVFGEKN